MAFGLHGTTCGKSTNYFPLSSIIFQNFPQFSPQRSSAFSVPSRLFAATWVAVNRRPPGPSPSLTCTPSLRPSLHRSFAVHHFGHHFVDHFVPPLSTLPSSIICRPSLILHHFVITLSITSPPSRVLHHFVDHLLSPTSSLPCPPSHRRSFVVHHFVDHLSSITSSLPCPPSHRRSFVVHHFIDHLPSITSSTTSPPSFVTFHHSPPGLTAFSPCIVVSPGGFQLD